MNYISSGNDFNLYSSINSCFFFVKSLYANSKLILYDSQTGHVGIDAKNIFILLLFI